MKHVLRALPILCIGLLNACSNDSSEPPAGDTAPAEHRELETAVKAPLDKAAGVNALIDEQDAAQRRAMDEQGR